MLDGNVCIKASDDLLLSLEQSSQFAVTEALVEDPEIIKTQSAQHRRAWPLPTANMELPIQVSGRPPARNDH